LRFLKELRGAASDCCFDADCFATDHTKDEESWQQS
jgi:hypothetical protein